MDPGYRSPLIDQFTRGETPRDMKVLAAEGGLAATAHEQLALLLLLSDDPDGEIAATVKATMNRLRSKLGEPPVIETVPRAGYRI